MGYNLKIDEKQKNLSLKKDLTQTLVLDINAIQKYLEDTLAEEIINAHLEEERHY